MMFEESLEEALFKLLEEDVFKPTFRVVQELRAEYPHIWKMLQKQGKEQYGRSCSAAQLPSNAVARCLYNMEKTGAIGKKISVNGQVNWNRKILTKEQEK